jgi:hypothetical protein
MTPAAVLDATARLVGAISIAFAGITVVKSRRASIRQWAAWIARLTVALPLFAVALWLVVVTVPYPHDPGLPTLSIVASIVFVTGLAIEELIGADVRRFLGF